MNNPEINNFIELLLEKGMYDMPFTIAANPSTNRVEKPHHYKMLRIMWRLKLVSLDAVRKCADALQEESTPRP